jgi:AcrR family transcriptional regulator
LAQLNSERIADAALAVVDAKGVSGFTIRAVARVLGVTPMALYYYVKDKADLAKFVVSAAHREIPLAALTGVWRDDMLAMARWTRENVTNHPALGELHSIYPVYTPEIIEMAERWLQLWQQSGLDLKSAVRAATVSSVVIAGLAAQGSVSKKLKPPSEDLVARNANVRKTFRREDPAAMFDLAIRSLIDGLHANLSKGLGRRRRSRREVTRRKSRRAKR